MLFVALVNHDESDTHAAKTVREAFELAGPNKGDRVDFFAVQSNDPGEARLVYNTVDTKHLGTIDATDWDYKGRVSMHLATITAKGA